MPERILDPADEPAVLLGDRREHLRTRSERLLGKRPRIVGDEQQPDGRRAERLGIGVAVVNPEPGVADFEVRDDLVVADLVQDPAPNAAL